MQRNSKDAGTLTALMIRLREQRLPRAQRMLERVNAGQVLQESDLQFLHTVFDDNRSLRPLMERNPEYQRVFSKMIGLYSEIVAKSLENEQNQPRS